MNGGYSFTVCLILYTLASQYVRHLYHKTLYCQGPLHNNKHIVKAWIHLRVITINAICVELEQENMEILYTPDWTILSLFMFYKNSTYFILLWFKAVLIIYEPLVNKPVPD